MESYHAKNIHPPRASLLNYKRGSSEAEAIGDSDEKCKNDEGSDRLRETLCLK
jgi:hypothetical protein